MKRALCLALVLTLLSTIAAGPALSQTREEFEQIKKELAEIKKKLKDLEEKNKMPPPPGPYIPNPQHCQVPTNLREPHHLEVQFIRSCYYAPNPKASEGVSADKLRILSATEKGKAWLNESYADTAFAKQHILVIPEAKRLANVPFMPKANGAFQSKDMFILEGQYLVTTSDGGTLYMDLAALDPDIMRGFVEVGGVLSDGALTISRITHKGVLPDALKIAGFKAREIEKIMKNLESALAGKTRFAVYGSRESALVVRVDGGRDIHLFPN